MARAWLWWEKALLIPLFGFSVYSCLCTEKEPVLCQQEKTEVPHGCSLSWRLLGKGAIVPAYSPPSSPGFGVSHRSADCSTEPRLFLGTAAFVFGGCSTGRTWTKRQKRGGLLEGETEA